MATGSKLAPDLSNWNPEDPDYWSSSIAWRTLAITTFSLTLAFCTWYLVSAIAPRLTAIGFELTTSQLYWLTAMPGLAGGLIRMLYMFLPPIVGTRKLVGFSSLLMVIPMVGWFLLVRDLTSPYWLLLLFSFLTGIGGGVFSGYMPSTGYFFPKRMAGTALGIQAGVGNFGVSLIQLLGPWIIGFGLLGLAGFAPQSTGEGSMWLHNVGIVLVPWTIVASILAFTLLKDVPIKANFRQQIDIFGNKNTWFLTAIYLMTFGAFSGFAAQTPLLINNTFGASSQFAGMENLPSGATFAFLGPLIASAARVLFGPLCDKFGGAIWTFLSGVGMTISVAVCALYLTPDSPDEFWPFLAALLALFLFAGIGNAGTFKQMPMIMGPRQAGGVIGFTAATAAFGPFIVGVALSMLPAAGFFWGCMVFFALCTVLTWVMYARPKAPFPG